MKRKAWLFTSLGGYSSGGASSPFHLHPSNVGWDESLNRLKAAKKGLKVTFFAWEVGWVQSTGQVNKTELKEISHYTGTREKKEILDYLGQLSFNFNFQKLKSRAD